jgi:hypothetical protein
MSIGLITGGFMKKQLSSGLSILRVERGVLFSQGAAARRIPAKWPLTEGERKLRRLALLPTYRKYSSQPHLLLDAAIRNTMSNRSVA